MNTIPLHNNLYQNFNHQSQTKTSLVRIGNPKTNLQHLGMTSIITIKQGMKAATPPIPKQIQSSRTEEPILKHAGTIDVATKNHQPFRKTLYPTRNLTK